MTTSTIRNKISAFLLLVFLTNLFNLQQLAGQDIPDIISLKKKYPKSDKVRLVSEAIIEISIEKDELKISQELIDEDIFLNESANIFSKEAVHHSAFYQLEKIEASSFNLENGVYSENKVTNFKEKENAGGSFHDDVKTINFTYPKLGKGAKTRLYVKENITNPRFLNSFYFGGFNPALKTKLTIKADNAINLDFKMFNTSLLDIAFKKTKKRNKTIYTWETKNISPFEFEVNSPDPRSYFPHIIPIITEYKTKENGVKKLSSKVDDLYKWYYSLVKNLNTDPTNKELTELVTHLTKDEPNEFEKVRAIYYWVQQNIKYIAFEYALGGFIPREANDVFNKKYGDCKDNSSILHEMLKVAGIKSYLTWVGTRSIPYKYDELPTPATDNHMILSYKYQDKTYFLDATGRFIPLELPTSFIQGKEALIGKGKDGFEIENIPVIDASMNISTDSAIIEIRGNSIKGIGKTKIKGYPKIDLFNAIEPITDENSLKTYYKSFLQKGNNKFLIDSLIEKNKFDYDKPFTIEYNFTVADYVVQSDDEVYINILLDKPAYEIQLDEKRKHDIEADYKQTLHFVNLLKVPSGYMVDYLPKNISLKNDFIEFEVKYKLEEQKVICSQYVKFDFLLLHKNKLSEYREIIKKIKRAHKETVVLKKM